MQLEETHAKDLSKTQETRETSIQVAYDLKIKNDELVESHTTLLKNFEKLRDTHKVTSSVTSQAFQKAEKSEKFKTFENYYVFLL